MWALIPILGGGFIGWLALQKRKRDAAERRFAEAALHRVNAKKPAPAPATRTVAPKMPVASTVATAPVKETTAPVEIATPVAAAAVVTRSSVSEDPKSQTPVVTPSKDASTAGILSMDDLKLAELTGVNFAGNASADAESPVEEI